MRYVEGLLKEENEDWHILMPASILHDADCLVNLREKAETEEKQNYKP